MSKATSIGLQHATSMILEHHQKDAGQILLSTRTIKTKTVIPQQQWTKQKKPFFKKKFTKQPKTSWKNKRPKKNQLEKMVDRMPVCPCVADGRKCWWCKKCGPKRRQTNSHHAAEHDPNFSFDKKSKKNSKSHGQVNVGEGLAPQCNLWLAEVRSLSCKPRNHFGQPLRKLHKQFGRRFKNVNSWFKKCKRCFNQLNLIKTKAELPQLTTCKNHLQK